MSISARVSMRLLMQFVRTVRHTVSAEMLVVSLLILGLLPLIGPTLQQRREQARQFQSRDRLRQIHLSAGNYHDAYQSFPVSPSVKLQPSVPRPMPSPESATDLVSPF